MGLINRSSCNPINIRHLRWSQNFRQRGLMSVFLYYFRQQAQPMSNGIGYPELNCNALWTLLALPAGSRALPGNPMDSGSAC
jgi:hypothetical protein